MTNRQQTPCRLGWLLSLLLVGGLSFAAAGCHSYPSGRDGVWPGPMFGPEEPTPIETPQEWIGQPRPEF